MAVWLLLLLLLQQMAPAAENTAEKWTKRSTCTFSSMCTIHWFWLAVFTGWVAENNPDHKFCTLHYMYDIQNKWGILKMNNIQRIFWRLKELHYVDFYNSSSQSELFRFCATLYSGNRCVMLCWCPLYLVLPCHPCVTLSFISQSLQWFSAIRLRLCMYC